METICKKCIERGGKRWNPIETKQYLKLFINLPWFSNLDDKKTNTLVNIAGQLQLIEFIYRLHCDCELTNESNFYNEETGDGLQMASGIESLLTKQGACAVGAIVEAICYTMLKYNNIETKVERNGYDIGFKKMLDLIRSNNLLPEDEIRVCEKIKDLRDRIHLFEKTETDYETFSQNEYDLTGRCLYYILQRWLDASDNIMQTYFYFIPRPSKETLSYNVSDFDLT